MVIGIQNAHEILDGHHMRCNNGTGGFHEKFPPLPPLLHPIITDFFSYGSIVKRPQLSPSRISFCIPMTISSLMFPGTDCIRPTRTVYHPGKACRQCYRLPLLFRQNSIFISSHIYAYLYTHTHTRTHVHTRTHTHTHTHSQTKGTHSNTTTTTTRLLW